MPMIPENSCCFTGHRKIDSANLSRLVDKLNFEISWLIGHEIKHFYTGGALGFDTIAALSVLFHKAQGADIKLHLMLPCPEQNKYWSKHDIDVFEDIKRRADSVTVLSEHYHGGVMHIRNRAMVDSCEYCVCYWDNSLQTAEKNGGGTLYTVNYAKKLRRKIINLWDEPPEDVQIEFMFDDE